MRITELKPKGFDGKEISDRLRNVFTRSSGGKITVRLPIFSYAYSDATISLEEQGKACRRNVLKTKRFFLENSYGTFDFDFKLRTSVLDNPKSWRGILEGKEPNYHPQTHELQNPEDFPPVSDYNGYASIRIYRLNPNIRDPKDPSSNNSLFRDYAPLFRENICRDVVEAAKSQGPNPWDDDDDLDDIWKWSLNQNEPGIVLFSSHQINRSVVRNVGPIEVGNQRSFGRIALNTESPSSSGWAVHAHELGHLFFPPMGDYYHRRTKDGKVTVQSRLGFLGSASIMAHHWSESHFDGFAKFWLGWTDPQMIEPDFSSKEVDLAAVYQDASNALLIYPEKHNKPGEFFLVEVRTKKGKSSTGHPIEFDQSLGSDLENGVVVYHINMTDPRSNDPDKGESFDDAEPYVDIEGEAYRSTKLVSLKPGDVLNQAQTSFYGNSENGLELEVLSAKADSTHKIRITWNREPKTAISDTHPDGNLHVFCRTGNGDPQYKRLEGAAWKPGVEKWFDLGGKITHRPTVSQAGRDLSVWVRGISGRPFMKIRRGTNGGSWEPSNAWDHMGGAIIGEVTSSKSGAFSEAVVRGVSGNCFIKIQTSSGWEPSKTNWLNIGGPIAGRPFSIGDRDHNLHIFARDPSGTPLYKTLRQNNWSPGQLKWDDLGGKINADPFAIAANDEIHVFVRGISGSVFTKFMQHNKWLPDQWISLGGQVMGPISAAFSNGEIWVFATGISGSIFVNKGLQEQWSGWESLGGEAIDSPVSVNRQRGIDVVVTGISGRAFHQRIDTSIWPPTKHKWKSIGGDLL